MPTGAKLKMDKLYKVVVSPEARAMLIEHAIFLSRVSESAGDHLVGEFEAAIQRLRQFPLANPPWAPQEPGEPPVYRKLLIYKRYLLIYEVEDDTVYVEYVIDCRRDNSWLMF